MKKYLTLAALLGIIAFISVSYLAQATEHADAPAAAPISGAAEYTPPATPAAAPSFAMNKDMCNTMTAAPAAEGTAPSEETKAAAFKKCMMDKGHTEEDLKKAAEEDKAKAATETPAAPAEEKPAAH